MEKAYRVVTNKNEKLVSHILVSHTHYSFQAELFTNYISQNLRFILCYNIISYKIIAVQKLVTQRDNSILFIKFIAL